MDKYIKIYDDVIDADSCNMLIGKFEAAEEDQYEEDSSNVSPPEIFIGKLTLVNIKYSSLALGKNHLSPKDLAAKAAGASGQSFNIALVLFIPSPISAPNHLV